MKTLLVILLTVAAVLAVTNSKPHAPTNFPSQFIAYFNETGKLLQLPDYQLHFDFKFIFIDMINTYYSGGMKALYWDVINKRARESMLNRRNQPSDHYLIYQAPGSEPGSVSN
jgi:hypothetical protein